MSASSAAGGFECSSRAACAESRGSIRSAHSATRRAIFDGPTATVDKMHCHITTLNPGEKSGEPSKHLQEEVIIVKEGFVEAHWDGQSKTGGPGSVIFFAAGATTVLFNGRAMPETISELVRRHKVSVLGAVPGQPGEAPERLGADLHRIVCLAARRCARMAVVKMRFIHYIKFIWREGSHQSGTNAFAAACQFLRH